MPVIEQSGQIWENAVMAQQGIQRVCFVIAPIGKRKSPERSHSDRVLRNIIEPATLECGYTCVRADNIAKPGIITVDIIKYLANAPLVIADLTNQNANVFYELALRHTLQKPVILIIPDGQTLPFDTNQSRAIFFNLDDKTNMKSCRQEIIEQIRAIEQSPEDYDNPISVAIDLLALRHSAKFDLEDIRKAFKRIPGLVEEDINRDLRAVSNALKQHSIETKGQLTEFITELISSGEILDILRALYINELLRSEDNPLDPIAVAVWGVYLFLYGVREETIATIKKGIRVSPEYAQKHLIGGELIILDAQYGANVSWLDVTRIVQEKVQNNSLNLLVANDTFGGADPAWGRKKSLKVTYFYEGQEHTKEAAEDETLHLP